MTFAALLVSGLSQYVALVGLRLALPQPAVVAGGPGDACIAAASYGALASLPAAGVAAPIGLTPYILRYTGHAVLAAGTHRNTAGILDDLTFFGDGEAAARSIAQARGLGYVVTCGTPPANGAVAADSFIAEARAGRRWNWLVPVSAPDATLAIYRIEPPAD
jgi:hypothetical protein